MISYQFSIIDSTLALGEEPKRRTRLGTILDPIRALYIAPESPLLRCTAISAGNEFTLTPEAPLWNAVPPVEIVLDIDRGDFPAVLGGGTALYGQSLRYDGAGTIIIPGGESVSRKTQVRETLLLRGSLEGECLPPPMGAAPLYFSGTFSGNSSTPVANRETSIPLLGRNHIELFLHLRFTTGTWAGTIELVKTQFGVTNAVGFSDTNALWQQAIEDSIETITPGGSAAETWLRQISTDAMWFRFYPLRSGGTAASSEVSYYATVSRKNVS